jgi:hypothetical protein
MIECRVRFNYPPHLLDQPIIYDFSKKFDVVAKILEANVTPHSKVGFCCLFEGRKRSSSRAWPGYPSKA